MLFIIKHNDNMKENIKNKIKFLISNFEYRPRSFKTSILHLVFIIDLLYFNSIY